MLLVIKYWMFLNVILSSISITFNQTSWSLALFLFFSMFFLTSSSQNSASKTTLKGHWTTYQASNLATPCTALVAILLVCPCADIELCLGYILYIYIYTSSTAQGGGGSFKNRKPIGEVGCCESGLAERIHWWTKRSLRSPLFRSLSLTIYLPTYLSSMYLSIDLSISLSLSLICLSVYLSTCLSVVQCHSV